MLTYKYKLMFRSTVKTERNFLPSDFSKNLFMYLTSFIVTLLTYISRLYFIACYVCKHMNYVINDILLLI